MAIELRNKIDSNFNMSGMSDIVFLLLIFFMVTSTLISPVAQDIDLPISDSQTSAKPLTTISITKDLKYFIEDEPVQFNQIESVIKQKVADDPEVYISLHADKSVPSKYVMRVMNIAKDNKYKLILATNPE